MASYTVQKGDTLSAIAKKYGTTYQEIAKANGISDPNKIYAGQTLKIGSDDTSTTNTSTSGTTATTPTTDQATTNQNTTTETGANNTNALYGGYTPSDTVTQAEQLLNQQLAQKPGEYQSQWQDQINTILQQILNREQFSYDVNADPMYQQYADLYKQQGNMAMMDTMGQAQAMTGGYGNSFAQSAGQQAYQAYLQQLNEVVPELYGMALDQYNQEGQDMLNQFAILGDQEDKEYGRYMDTLNAWLTERDYLAGRYDTERDYDYGMWADNRDYEYQVGRDQISDEQWQKEFEEAQRQFNQQYALKTSGSSGGSSSGSSSSKSSSSTGSGYNNGSVSSSQVKDMQRALGVTADGLWGAQSQAAAQKAWGTSSADSAWTYYTGKVRVPGGPSQTDDDDTGASAYSSWSAGTWEAYFARIRQSEGQAAALEELNYFTRNGLIPSNMVTYASSGARGGQMGH